jgi:hypothetical protein
MQLLLFRYGDNNVFSRICALYSQALSSIKVEDMTPRFGQRNNNYFNAFL